MLEKQLNVGVLASGKQQLNTLVLLVQSTGEGVAAAIEVGNAQYQDLPAVDVWVAHIDSDDTHGHLLLEQIESDNIPLVYDDAQEVLEQEPSDEYKLMPHQLRQAKANKLLLKLNNSICGQKSLGSHEALKRAHYIWVLAASTGGPEAVVRFLQNIPDTIEGVAFLYVQHIDDSGSLSLRQTIENHCTWQVSDTDSSTLMTEKTLYIVSPRHQVELLETGVLSVLSEAWNGPFSPSIDQVIAKVARVYGERGGAIIFTGMGEDGAFSSNMLSHKGGHVWVQSAETCAVDSMPVNTQKRGCVSYVASPEGLATQFNQHMASRQ